MTQLEFYRSNAWRRLSKAFLMSRNYICERCGAPADIAHHKKYLTAENVIDPDISLNPDNLIALCQNCHNAEHFSQGGATAAGLVFDADGNIRPIQTETSKGDMTNELHRAHEEPFKACYHQ